MKTKLLIIIGIIIAVSGILILTIPNDEYDDESYKPSLEQLQMVFDHCNDTSEIKTAIGLEYFNDTHYINNNICGWQVLEKYPNSNRLCIPGQDYSDEEIRNDTHVYNRDKCSWEIAFSWYDEYTRSAIDNIRIHGNNDNGANPSLLKYCLSGGTSDGFTINNSTHHFDFETCKWENHPLKIQVCRGGCDDDFPENQKTKSEDERKNFCESHEGRWSDEFNNCVGGSMEVSCDDVGVSELTPASVFGKIITQDGLCISHAKLCSSMGGNTACMSYEQKGHGRDICIAVCNFESVENEN